MNNNILLLQKATKEAILGITNSKLATMEGYEILSAFNGEDDYVDSLLEIVTRYDDKPDPEAPKKANEAQKTGVTVVKLKQVFGDNETLTSARKKLVDQKKIIEVKEGQTMRINLFKSNEPT